MYDFVTLNTYFVFGIIFARLCFVMKFLTYISVFFNLVFVLCPWSVFAVDAAGSDNAVVAQAVWERINRARLNPWAEAQREGIDAGYLRTVVSEDVATMWDNGLAPLVWNECLAQSAASHLADMLERLYFSHITPEGFTLPDRLESLGCDFIFAGEGMGAIAFPAVMAEAEAADIVVSGLLYDALFQNTEGIPLLDYLMQEVGVSVAGGRINYEGVDYNIIMVVADFKSSGFSVPDGSALLTGHLFVDRNNNSIFDEGEGLANTNIEITGPVGVYGPDDPVYNVKTDSYGRYMVLLQNGFYSLKSHDLEDEIYLDGEQTQNYSLDLVVEQ